MRYRSQIIEEQAEIDSKCTGNCVGCPVFDLCYSQDSYEGQDVIEDM